MKRVNTLLISLCISANLFAAQTSVQMNGTVSSSCSFTSSAPGTLAISPTNPKELSSLAAGGASATVGVAYIGTPTLTIDGPTSFDSAPSGFAPTNITFTPYATSNQLGNITFSNSQGSKQYTTGNSDNVYIGLSVSSSSAFDVGSYTTTTTLTCQ